MYAFKPNMSATSHDRASILANQPTQPEELSLGAAEGGNARNKNERRERDSYCDADRHLPGGGANTS
jgi:hypothetical protein